VVLTAGKCRSCQAPVVFVRTAASGGAKSMPLDVEPTDAGNVWLNEKGQAVVVGAATPAPDGARMFLSHFATCPNRAEHRRSKR
jgi:hypothetical protein